MPEKYVDAIEQKLIYVAEESGELIGFGWLILQDPEIRAVYVDPSNEGQGVGTTILRSLEERASSHGVLSLELGASLTRYRSRRSADILVETARRSISEPE